MPVGAQTRRKELDILTEQLGRLQRDKTSLERQLQAASQKLTDLEADLAVDTAQFEEELGSVRKELDELSEDVARLKVQRTQQEEAIAGVEVRARSPALLLLLTLRAGAGRGRAAS
jgi:chromosome segregation ATPase